MPKEPTRIAPTPVAAAVTPVPRPPKQYEGKGFQIGDAERALAVPFLFSTVDGKVTGPTPAQQSVIFSDAVATTVLAGAGSGKSTTLVQRVLFMRKVLKIDFGLMAVFTFTRKSRRDFITKLLKEAPNWGVALDEKQAERLVRTFHSKALNLSRGLLGKGEQIFEFLDTPREKVVPSQAHAVDAAVDDELLESEQNANEIDGFPEIEGKEKQAELLKDVYAICYNKSDTFRAAILTIYQYTLMSRPVPKDDTKFVDLIGKLQWMSSYDLALSQHVEAAWEGLGLWPIHGVTARSDADKRFELVVMGETFRANGYIEALDIFVVLGPCQGVERPGPFLAKQKVKPLPAIWNKRRAILAGCDKKVRFVSDAEDLNKLRMQLACLNGERGLSAPAVQLRLPGEKLKFAFETLYGFGSFAETIGLAPNRLSQVLQDTTWSTVEVATITAVSEFFEEFYAELKKQGIVTFNQIFARLGDGSAHLKNLSISTLIGVKHLMIDEFQDISPLIVSFVRGVQAELLRKSGGSQRPTIMCVGDDWQSIYGWRGSSPHFLLRLQDFFPGASAAPIQMEENFRSSQKIVDCGEAFIAHVQVKSPKRGIASKVSVKDLPHLVGAVTTYSSADIKYALRGILERAEVDAEVYVLAATHDELKAFKSVDDERLTCTTYHQSKGLEADYVILVGSPKYFGANDLKNGLYAAAKFPQSFDAAQKDEAFRVAYVAATRAKKFCLWFAEPTPGSVIEAVPADGIHRLQLREGSGLQYVEQCV